MTYIYKIYLTSVLTQSFVLISSNYLQSHNAIAYNLVLRRSVFSDQWLNGADPPQFTPADSAAAMFLLSELAEIHSHV